MSKQELLSAVWPDVFVGDAVLKGTIRELRKALGDDSHEPRFIETAHRRGYRFIPQVTVIDAATAPAPLVVPRVRDARSGSVNIAYQVVGSGPIRRHRVRDGVGVAPRVLLERAVVRVSFLTRLASMARLILFDKRGTGLSDAVPLSELPSLEQRMFDVQAVMEAAGSRRAVLMGVSEGGPLCTLFAATHPDMTAALDHDRQLRAAAVGRLTTRGARRSDERDRFCLTIIEQMGRAGGHRRARALARARSGVSQLVGGVFAHGREPRRGGGPDADERGSGYPRRAGDAFACPRWWFIARATGA